MDRQHVPPSPSTSSLPVTYTTYTWAYNDVGDQVDRRQSIFRGPTSEQDLLGQLEDDIVSAVAELRDEHGGMARVSYLVCVHYGEWIDPRAGYDRIENLLEELGVESVQPTRKHLVSQNRNRSSTR